MFLSKNAVYKTLLTPVIYSITNQTLPSKKLY